MEHQQERRRRRRSHCELSPLTSVLLVLASIVATLACVAWCILLYLNGTTTTTTKGNDHHHHHQPTPEPVFYYFGHLNYEPTTREVVEIVEDCYFGDLWNPAFTTGLQNPMLAALCHDLHTNDRAKGHELGITADVFNRMLSLYQEYLLEEPSDRNTVTECFRQRHRLDNDMLDKVDTLRTVVVCHQLLAGPTNVTVNTELVDIEQMTVGTNNTDDSFRPEYLQLTGSHGPWRSRRQRRMQRWWWLAAVCQTKADEEFDAFDACLNRFIVPLPDKWTE